MSEVQVPIQAVVNNLTGQISQLSYELAVAKAALDEANARIAQLTRDSGAQPES